MTVRVEPAATEAGGERASDTYGSPLMVADDAWLGMAWGRIEDGGVLTLSSPGSPPLPSPPVPSPHLAVDRGGGSGGRAADGERAQGEGAVLDLWDGVWRENAHNSLHPPPFPFSTSSVAVPLAVPLEKLWL